MVNVFNTKFRKNSCGESIYYIDLNRSRGAGLRRTTKVKEWLSSQLHEITGQVGVRDGSFHLYQHRRCQIRRCGARKGSDEATHRLAGLNGLGQGVFIGVFDIHAHGDSTGQTTEADAGIFEDIGEVRGSCFARNR